MEARAQVDEIAGKLAGMLTEEERERLRRLIENPAAEEASVETTCVPEKTEPPT